MRTTTAAVVTVLLLACGASRPQLEARRNARTVGGPPHNVGPEPAPADEDGYAELCAPRPDEPELQAGASDADAEEAWAGRVRKPRTKDLCETADTNLALAEKAILAGTAPSPEPSLPHARSAKGAAGAKYMDKVDARLHLSSHEKGMLDANGFVVLASKPAGAYATAYHDIFQMELPVFVSADSILHSVYASNDTIIASIEAGILAPSLDRVLRGMSCALPGAMKEWPPEVARDADLYLTVARALLRDRIDDAPALLAETKEQANALYESAQAADALAEVELFGRPRMIDFTQYAPRGHYASNVGYSPFMMIVDPKSGTAIGSITSYFRASMWLSRLELNLQSRGCRSSGPGEVCDPRETPREAQLALALAELAERANVGGELARLENAWSLFGGKREDVPLEALLALRKKAGIVAIDGAAPDKLAHAIGGGFKRTARLHYMPQGARELPVIATLLGARVVADPAATQPLGHDELPGRALVRAADMAYALGHDRAKAYLADDRARFPALDAQLEKARTLVRAPPAPDMYGAWLNAIAKLADPPRGLVPAFMESPSFQDFRMNSAIVGYGQIRHNYVLIAGQGYDAYGCEIPDGWVEPALATYEALTAYAERGRAAIKAIDPEDRAGVGSYFARLGEVLRVLQRIARDELAGRTLSVEERRWLAMVAEYIPVGGYSDSGAPPRYTGWYFDLFPHRDHDAKLAGDFIADYFTSTNAGKVAYIGASEPRLGVFLVDTNGAPRVMVGPVARGYERTEPIARRLDDEAARALPIAAPAWEKSYTAAAAKPPPIAIAFEEKAAVLTVSAKSTRALGPVVLELLDHHGAAFARKTASVGAAKAQVRFDLPARRGFTGGSPVEGVHLQIGDFHHVAGVSAYRALEPFALGGMSAEPSHPAAILE
jgi:Protein of unknown function (DUF3160)